MIIYLSGPISDRLDTYKEHFQSVYDALTAAGHFVISPHFLPIGLKSHQDYMNIAHPSLKAADAIYLLIGWQHSPGARTELKWAMDWNKEIYIQNDNTYNWKLYANEEEENEVLKVAGKYQSMLIDLSNELLDVLKIGAAQYKEEE